MTVMEAMACGVPCVTTDVGDCALLLEGAGRVAPARQPEALEQAWEQVLAAPPATDAVRQLAVERFDIGVAARAYERVYREVVVL